MMNNEIIKFLQSKQIPQCGDKEYTADEEYEAYQRAIDALEQQTSDTVSRGVFEQVMWERNVAIDQLKELGYELGQKVEPCENAVSRADMLDAVGHGATYTSEEVQKIVNNLPSVTPQQKYGKWINGDCICPCCGEDKFKDLDADIWSDWKPKYCPNCGCRMIEPQESEEE